MEYSQFPAPPDLARSVECLWILRGALAPEGQTILPDGRMELLFHFGSPPTSSVPPPEKRSSRPVKPGANFALVDSLERPWSFAASRSGSLVLLDFMSTNCVHCKRTIPVLTDLQSRYAADGLELIGVLCDDVPQRERATQAAKYQRENNLNYAIYVEPGAEAGAVRDRFHVESYPTAVLLNGEGTVLWQGHPAKRMELESAIRKHLGR